MVLDHRIHQLPAKVLLQMVKFVNTRTETNRLPNMCMYM